MPLFKIKSPGNVNAFNDFFSDIAKFQLVDTKALTLDAGIYIPEMDSLSLNYQNAGYDTTLSLPCLGTIVLVLFAQIVLVTLHVLVWLCNKYCDNFNWLESKIARYLYWNGSIRFFMEAYLDFVMFSLLNIKTMSELDDRFVIVKASNILSIILLTVSMILPIAMCIIWALKHKQWDQDEFAERYGSLLENTDYRQRKWYVLFVPMTYFLRRLGLGLVCIFWIDFFWGQVAIQLMTSVFVIILLHWAKPMGSRFDTYIETFNEIITLITLYCLMCFSDFILDEQRRSELG